MCWNASVSLNTFLFGAFAVSLGLLNNTVPITKAVFYMSFISMQLVEFFLWKNLHIKDANRFWSKVALFLICIQPIAALSFIGLTNPLTWALIVAYLIFITLFITFVSPLDSIDFSSDKAANGHLRWNWSNFPLWAIAIWVAFLFAYLVYVKDWPMLAVNLALVAVMYAIFVRTKTWGSLWCWVANAISLIILWGVFSKDVCLYLKPKKS